MWRLLSAPVVVLSCVASAALPAVQESSETFVFRECPEVASWMRSADGIERILNPVLRSRAEIDNAASQHREMLACLESVRYRTALPDWFQTVRYHLELFLTFASPIPGAGPSRQELVDLSTVDDPAVRMLREDVGLPVPGGLVFVSYFPDRESMPEIIRPAFTSPQTQAVTIGSRYVAVLTGSASGPGPAIRRSLAATFSHELVHAYLNAGLDWQTPRRFPAWFHEGMAIHFSGSGQAHVSVGPMGEIARSAPTSDYERYERVFLYLDHVLGEAGLNQAIRASVGTVDTEPLLEAAGEASYDDLLDDAELWWRWWPVPPGLVRSGSVWLVGGMMLLFLGAARAAWRRWQPAVPGSSLEVNLNRDLIGAVRQGDLDEVHYLLRSGASPNARDDEDWPVLLWAVWLGRADIADVLVGEGARVTPGIRQATRWREDPDVERVVADAMTRQREVW